jgi:hypothetical protein
MTDPVIQDMCNEGLCQSVDCNGLDAFLDGDGLKLLLFAGQGGSHGHDQGHDVAVALRELLRDYHGQLAAAWIADGEERKLMARCRVAVIPSLVFAVGGEIMEVLPRVRDWADYQAAFRRYLGAPQAQTMEIT